jgi:hypothetical protein
MPYTTKIQYKGEGVGSAGGSSRGAGGGQWVTVGPVIGGQGMHDGGDGGVVAGRAGVWTRGRGSG